MFYVKEVLLLTLNIARHQQLESLLKLNVFIYSKIVKICYSPSNLPFKMISLKQD